MQTYLVRGRGFTEAALVLSSLTYVVGATANGLGGLAGDRMVRRHGLRNARRWLGVAGLSAAALCLSATLYAPSGNLALVFLSLLTVESCFSSRRSVPCASTSGARTPARSSDS